jgi:arylsulfatase A-like enzyme
MVCNRWTLKVAETFGEAAPLHVGERDYVTRENWNMRLDSVVIVLAWIVRGPINQPKGARPRFAVPKTTGASARMAHGPILCYYPNLMKFIVALGLILISGTFVRAADASRLPNIIFILADDLGYGDLGCYDQAILKTPHIDRLAFEGKRFTQFYAGSTVCAPSRCVLMTGIDTGHCLIRGNAQDNLRPNDLVIPEMLTQQGYVCGHFGKWGLGHEGSQGIPTRKGFESFYGYLDHGHAHNFFPTFLIRNEARVPLRNVVPNELKNGAGVATDKIDFAPDLILDEAKSFIRSNAKKPFFVYLSINMPHANNEAKVKGMEDIGHGPFESTDWPNAEKGFAENIRRLDQSVGQVIDLVDGLGLKDNTLILFTSDNGPHHEGGHEELFFKSAGPLRGSKRDLTEGGIRVPLIARWPSMIEPTSISQHVCAFQDIFPTLADVAHSDRVPKGPGSGISFSPSLIDTVPSTKKQLQHDYLYWSFYEGKKAQAIRFGDWKAIEQPLGSAIRLYDLKQDQGEHEDLAGKHPDLVEQAVKRMKEAYEPGQGQWKL